MLVFHVHFVLLFINPVEAKGCLRGDSGEPVSRCANQIPGSALQGLGLGFRAALKGLGFRV